MLGGAEALETFRGHFSLDKVTKESELVFTCTPDGRLATSVRGELQQENTSTGPLLGAVRRLPRRETDLGRWEEERDEGVCGVVESLNETCRMGTLPKPRFTFHRSRSPCWNLGDAFSVLAILYAPLS